MKQKHESSTYGIKHWYLSGYSGILPSIKFDVTGQKSFIPRHFT